jgi:hypothetical protein
LEKAVETQLERGESIGFRNPMPFREAGGFHPIGSKYQIKEGFLNGEDTGSSEM